MPCFCKCDDQGKIIFFACRSFWAEEHTREEIDEWERRGKEIEAEIERAARLEEAEPSCDEPL